MKKLVYLLFALVLIIPVKAKADMGSPMFTYEVRVSNPDGAQDYDYKYDEEGKVTVTKTKDIVKYDTVLSVDSEITLNDKDYLLVYTNDEKRNQYVLLSSDVDVNGKPDLKNYEQEYSLNMEIIREGAYLYNGPSYKYGKTSDNYELPVGTRFKTKYYDEIFAYVEVDGHKGWVYTYQYDKELSPYNIYGFAANVYDSEKANKIYTIKDEKAYVDLFDKKSESITIPANTEIKPELVYSSFAHYGTYKIEYNGKEYWIFDGDDVFKTLNENDNYILTKKDVKIYKDPGTFENKFAPSKETGTIIPKYTKVKYNYSYMTEYGEYEFYEVTYKGTTGWIYIDSTDNVDKEKTFAVSNRDDYNYTLTSELKVYENPSKNGKEDKVKTVPSGTKITVLLFGDYEELDSKWFYVVTDKYQGWAVYTNGLFKEIEDNKIDPREDIEPEDEDVKPKRDQRHNKKVAPSKDEEVNHTLLYVIVISVIVVISGIVTIIFINKKKKNKKVELTDSDVEFIKENVTVAKKEKKSKK